MKKKIVFATDNNFLVFSFVAIYSLLKNCQYPDKLEIYLLHDGSIKQKKFYSYKKKLKNSLKADFTLTLKSIGNVYENSPLSISHISKATFYRLYIPSLFPDEQVLYLDSDILVLQDILEIFQTEIKDSYLAGVYAPGYHENESWVKDYCKRNLLPSLNSYVNAGVLIFNNPKIIKDGVFNKFNSLSFRKFDSQDQDILNSVCYGRIFPLRYKYNAMLSKYSDRLELLHQVFGSDVESDIKNPVIIHFADKKKPWNDKKIDSAEIWWKYANELGVKKEIIVRYFIMERIKWLLKRLFCQS